MSNKSEIAIIAEAVLANCRILELLIAKLPDATKAEVAKEVAKVNPTPVPVEVQAPAATPAPAPTVAPTTAPAAPAPVVEAPVPTPAPVVKPAAPVATPSPTAGAVPFTDHKGMVTYIMNTYREIGAERGQKIQLVLNSLGVPNINDVKPEHFAPLYAEVEKIRTGV